MAVVSAEKDGQRLKWWLTWEQRQSIKEKIHLFKHSDGRKEVMPKWMIPEEQAKSKHDQAVNEYKPGHCSWPFWVRASSGDSTRLCFYRAVCCAWCKTRDFPEEFTISNDWLKGRTSIVLLFVLDKELYHKGWAIVRMGQSWKMARLVEIQFIILLP